MIGNPPYIDIIGIPPAQRDYFGKRYKTFLYRSDILSVFFERAVELLKNKGRIGFITSNTYLTSTSASKLRPFLLRNLCIEKIINIGGGVFSKANVDTAILCALKDKIQSKHRVSMLSCQSVGSFVDYAKGKDKKAYSILQEELSQKATTGLVVMSGIEVNNIISRLGREKTVKVGEAFEISRGYIAYDAHRGHSSEMINKKVYHADRKLDNRYKKELLGSDIGRYFLRIKSKKWILFGSNLAAPRHTRFHTGPRIWIQRIRNPKLKQRLVCYFTDLMEDLAASSGLSIVRSINPDYSCRALCGLLNSRFINWWYSQNFHEVNIKPTDIATIPLPPNWLVTQHEISEAVKELQSLLIRSIDSRNSIASEVYQRQIADSDRRIDKVIYNLYGLTADEIRIVEEATNPSGI